MSKKITELTQYNTPADSDVLPIVKVSTLVTYKITWGYIKSVLKTYFDTIYTTMSAVLALGYTTMSAVLALGYTTISAVGVLFAPKANPTFTGTVTADTLKTNAVTLGAFNYCVDTASTDTYVASVTPAITALAAGLEVTLKVNTANTGASTFNLNGLGAKAIVKRVSTATVTGDILASMLCKLIYDGTAWVIMNPRVL